MDIEAYTLDDLSKNLWATLHAASQDRSHGFHTVAVANASGGQPRVRTVVLRHADASAKTLTFHTDARAQKIADLEQDGAVEFLFYDPEARLQLAVSAVATIHHDDAMADAAWAESPPLSRRCYLSQYAPGTPLDAPASGLPDDLQSRRPEEAETNAGREYFAVVTCEATALHALSLKATGNLAARFTYDAGALTGASWVAP